MLSPPFVIQVLICWVFFMFIFCHQRQKTNQKNAAQEERGLVREKANMPHFLVLRHPLPLSIPSPVGRADEVEVLILKGEITLSISSRSRDLNEA